MRGALRSAACGGASRHCAAPSPAARRGRAAPPGRYAPRALRAQPFWEHKTKRVVSGVRCVPFFSCRYRSSKNYNRARAQKKSQIGAMQLLYPGGRHPCHAISHLDRVTKINSPKSTPKVKHTRTHAHANTHSPLAVQNPHPSFTSCAPGSTM